MNDQFTIDAREMHYRKLNNLLRNSSGNGIARVKITNVYGQRYIGTNLRKPLEITVHGVPGNDLGAFMDGSTLIVYGNVQDGCGNTMNDGRIVVHGHAGDVTGHSMRGGKIFIRDDAGFRLGIHMKEFQEKKPIIVVGGTAQDFLGEYMAGGILVVLGLHRGETQRHRARFVGTGMHGGVMFIRGEVSHFGKDVEISEVDDQDERILRTVISEFCSYFRYDVEKILDHDFTKIIPVSYRPYGRLYAY
jgi:glutamate synthase domain-containing protein 3